MPQGFDQVRICNMALSNVGAPGTIESIDEETPEAKECKLWFEGARIATLEAYNWTFARKSVALTAHALAAPSNRWAFRYQWPSDCVASRELENPAGIEEDAIPFDIEIAEIDGSDTLSIVTDLEAAVLIYTKDQRNLEMYSFHSVLMMSYRLGFFINPVITGKMETTNRMNKRFYDLLLEAPTQDAQLNVPRKERDPAWIRARK
jgi:hypothetical protein